MARDIASDPRPRVRPPKGRSIIAVIGIDKYPAWPALSNAVNDANGVAQLFQRLGFIELTPPLLNGAATREAMWRLVTDEFAKLDSTDSLVLFFAGHGHTRITYPDGKPTKIGYVVPVDAAEDRAATWVRLDFWLNEVALLPPRHILVIVDACHSGVALDAVVKWRGAALSTAALDDLQARRSRRIITSALDDQRAMDGGPYPGHSLFTGCLIEGITGGIATRGQRIATGSQIGMYLQQRVSSYPRSQQTPDFGALDLDQRGEIVVPLLSAATEADTEPELTAWGRDSGPEMAHGETAADDESLMQDGHASQLGATPVQVAAHEASVMQAPAAGQKRLATSLNKLAMVGGLVILSGCVAVGYAVIRPASGGMSEAQTAAMAGAIARLDGAISAARAAVKERANTLSKLVAVRATIGSDAAIVADQIKRGELEFAPGEGEILELGQIKKAVNNAVEELMVQPAGAMHTMHDGAAGSYADVVDNQLVITEVVEVVPAYVPDRYRGFLTVSRSLSLAPALKPLLDAGVTGKMVVGDKSVPVGAMPPWATTRDEPLASQTGVKLVVAEPPRRAVLPLPILVGGIGGVVIGLLLLVISVLGHRDAQR